MENNRFVTVSGDAANGLLFGRMRGQESLGRLFEFEIEFLSEDDSIDLSSTVGRQLTVRVSLPAGGFRYFDGIVAQFKFIGMLGRYARYQAVLRPRWWLLTRTATSRIFQRKSVPAIVQEIFRDRGITDFEERLVSTYRTWDYLVQYRESDWNFISRILEEEGVYYYFLHDDGVHKLVLADSFGAHDTFPGYETIPYATEGDQAYFGDHVDRWTSTRQLVSGAYAAKDFNFEVPKLQSLNRLSAPTGTAHDDLEVYHYPGSFRNNAEGQEQVRIRLQEHQADCEVSEGSGDSRGVGSGFFFTLTDHPRRDQNRQYLAVTVWYDIAVNGYETGDMQSTYRCSFAAIPSGTQFRAPQTTLKPRVEGPQTATVVGPAGEEIWTDNYGRVKLQFHWDRLGDNDEDSSCWVRVSQALAGANWGTIHIPRIGQEVVVEFLEGDPDRPLVTGGVYNARNLPPYALPAKQTQSGIKTRSTKGGAPTNANEIRFEDLKGSEELFVQAEKDQRTIVKHDQTINVGADQSIFVGGDRAVQVTGNLAVTVSGKGKSAIKGLLDVTGNYRIHTSDTIDADAPTHINFECGDSSILIEPGKITISAGGGASLVLDANALAKASGGAALSLTGDALLQSSAGSQLQLDAAAALSTSGAASVHGGTVTVEGDSDAKLTGGGGTVDATGGMVKINSG